MRDTSAVQAAEAPLTPSALRAWLPTVAAFVAIIGGGFVAEYRLGLVETVLASTVERLEKLAEKLGEHEKEEAHPIQAERTRMLETSAERAAVSQERILLKLETIERRTLRLCAANRIGCD